LIPQHQSCSALPDTWVKGLQCFIHLTTHHWLQAPPFLIM
jgi:hypothetical protein